MNLETMPLNARTAKTIAKRVMKNMDMQVVNRFSPVESKYQFHIGDKKRITLHLTEDKFIQTEEQLNKGRWKLSTQSVKLGSMPELENFMLESVSNIVELGKRFKTYRNIK